MGALLPAREATVLTVGGLFDFFSGCVPRAPLAWREVELEWMCRLLQEPRRSGSGRRGCRTNKRGFLAK